ncbi:MAG: hypothetical protein ACR2KV_13155 [Solirubrobacteraceae bacterium]
MAAIAAIDTGDPTVVLERALLEVAAMTGAQLPAERIFPNFEQLVEALSHAGLDARRRPTGRRPAPARRVGSP